MVFFLDFTGRFHRENNQEETITPGLLLIPSRRLCSSLAASPEVLSLASPHSLVSDSSLLHASSSSMNFDWVSPCTCVCGVCVCVHSIWASSPGLHRQSPCLLQHWQRTPLSQGTQKKHRVSNPPMHIHRNTFYLQFYNLNNLLSLSGLQSFHIQSENNSYLIRLQQSLRKITYICA